MKNRICVMMCIAKNGKRKRFEQRMKRANKRALIFLRAPCAHEHNSEMVLLLFFCHALISSGCFSYMFLEL